jgi:lysophospholipase L1-like esterase
MKRVFTTLILAVALVALASASPARADEAKDLFYVSLGDSLAQGFQPIGGNGRDFPYSGYAHGYADQLFTALRDDIPRLELVKLGCGGSSTDDVITGGPHCTYPHGGSQLDEAVAFIDAHPGQVRLITIDVGAIDVLFGPPIGAADCFDEGTGVWSLACVNSALPGVQARLTTIIDTLQAAAPGVPIIGMSYFNPFLGFWALLPAPAGPFLAQTDEQTLEALNAGLVSVYQSEGVPVADVAGRFAISDLTIDLAVGLPSNVVRACQWTWFCTGPPHGPDVHANTEGYGEIAQAFLEVIQP